MARILSINPGSTTTKIGLYENDIKLFTQSITHTPQELDLLTNKTEQSTFRKNLILSELKNSQIALDTISVIVGRGGLLRPLPSGIYEVNNKLLNDLLYHTTGEHASNLGGIIAQMIANDIAECKAYIADPVVVDEMQDIARISGLPFLPRKSQFHALNHKAMGRKYAKSINTEYEQLNLIIAHMGGGISVAAHKQGKVIDLNQGLDGYGPFSPERAGTIDAGQLIQLCFSKKHSEQELKNYLAGKGGLMAHLGTNDVKTICSQIEKGDLHAKLILEAMAYNVAKEIGSMFAVLEGKVDATILTGGIAHSKLITSHIEKMISGFTKVIIYPGEDELEALALSGLRIIHGEQPLEYI